MSERTPFEPDEESRTLFRCLEHGGRPVTVEEGDGWRRLRCLTSMDHHEWTVDDPEAKAKK